MDRSQFGNGFDLFYTDKIRAEKQHKQRRMRPKASESKLFAMNSLPDMPPLPDADYNDASDEEHCETDFNGIL